MIRLLLVWLLFWAVYRLGRHVERHALSSSPETTRTDIADDSATTRGPPRRRQTSRTPHRKRATRRITVRSWRRPCPHCLMVWLSAHPRGPRRDVCDLPGVSAEGRRDAVSRVGIRSWTVRHVPTIGHGLPAVVRV